MSETGAANRGKTPDPSEANRRSLDAASVSKRWWETPATPAEAQRQAAAIQAAPASPTGSSPAAASNGMAAPPPPPPPAMGWNPAPAGPIAGSEGSAAELARIQRLEQELAAAREEATALHEMLEELPEIFEHKFRQRLHGVLEQQQLLLADNRRLRDQLYALQPAETLEARLLPAADSWESDADPDQGRAEPLRRMLDGMRSLGRRLNRSTRMRERDIGDDPINDRDDGQPRAA